MHLPKYFPMARKAHSGPGSPHFRGFTFTPS